MKKKPAARAAKKTAKAGGAKRKTAPPRRVAKRQTTGSKSKARPRRSAARRKARSVTSEFEKLLQSAARTPQRYVLKLYVTGTTPRSSRAITNIRSLCDRHLVGRYDLQIIDIYQQPTLARGDQIIAAPTLIRTLPSPLRKVIGDLSDEQQVLMGLDLSPQNNDVAATSSITTVGN